MLHLPEKKRDPRPICVAGYARRTT